MKLSVLYTLECTAEQTAALHATVEHFRRAVQFVADYAFANQIFFTHELQRKIYSVLRQDFALPAQMAIYAISQAVHACRDVARDHRRLVPPQIGDINMIYDHRIMSLKGVSEVSLRCLTSRELIASDPLFVMYGFSLVSARSLGQGELFIHDGHFYFALTVDSAHSSPDRIFALAQDMVKFVEAWSEMPAEVQGRRDVPGLYKVVQRENPQSVMDAVFAAAGREAPRLQRSTNYSVPDVTRLFS